MLGRFPSKAIPSSRVHSSPATACETRACLLCPVGALQNVCTPPYRSVFAILLPGHSFAPENLPGVALIAAIQSFAVNTNIPIAEASAMGARAYLSLAPCSRLSTPLRAACRGDLRSVLTAAPRGASRKLRRDGETPLSLTKKHPSLIVLVLFVKLRTIHAFFSRYIVFFP
jgi:hypothetical protein